MPAEAYEEINKQRAVSLYPTSGLSLSSTRKWGHAMQRPQASQPATPRRPSSFDLIRFTLSSLLFASLNLPVKCQFS